MKNRHNTAAKVPQFDRNSLMHGQMRKIMPGGEACFVSIFVYFCLLLPQTKGANVARIGSPTARERVRPVWPQGFGRWGRIRIRPTCRNAADRPVSRAIRAAPIRDTRGYPPQPTKKNG